MIIVLGPTNFCPEQTTVWSFPIRGNWATHSGKYRGNWSPYIPRNLILRYSNPGDWILDQFVGSGTTLVEAKLLNRNAIGVDINPHSVSLSETNLNFNRNTKSKIFIKQGNAMDLSILKDESIDLICTHPPYLDIIKYSKDIRGDLSLLSKDKFWKAIEKVASESYRVLKKEKYCAVMMGDIRQEGDVVPLGFKTMQSFINMGFKLKEIIIKEQHNCKSTGKWMNIKRNFLLLAHEYIFVFYK
ncbi:MAG: methyltransferase domain-containing protein [Lachnospiraceae bacterium]|nr:methyltransferase domain-containing protein [Lachnospiraceae bacterium]